MMAKSGLDSSTFSYIGWVQERMPDGYFEDPKVKWDQRFIIFKGADVCVFEAPPVSRLSLQRVVVDCGLKLSGCLS